MRGVMHIDLEDAYGVKTGVTVTVLYERTTLPEEWYSSHYTILTFSVEPPALSFSEHTKLCVEATDIFWQRVGVGRMA